MLLENQTENMEIIMEEAVIHITQVKVQIIQTVQIMIVIQEDIIIPRLVIHDMMQEREDITVQIMDIHNRIQVQEDIIIRVMAILSMIQVQEDIIIQIMDIRSTIQELVDTIIQIMVTLGLIGRSNIIWQI